MRSHKQRHHDDEASPTLVERLTEEELRRRGREWDRELVRKLSTPIGKEDEPAREERRPKIA
jgi:hypothetical protein